MKARSMLKAAALGGSAIAVGVWSSTDDGRDRDAAAFRKVNAGKGPSADRIYEGITEMGSLWAAGSAAAAIALLGHRKAAVKSLAAASATWLVGQGLKRAFLRPRPYEADPDGTRLLIGKPHGASWPSSHPAVLVTFLTVASRELELPASSRRLLDALASAVGLSRVYLGVHYPSDITGGTLIGRAVAELFSDGR